MNNHDTGVGHKIIWLSEITHVTVGLAHPSLQRTPLQSLPFLSVYTLLAIVLQSQDLPKPTIQTPKQNTIRGVKRSARSSNFP